MQLIQYCHKKFVKDILKVHCENIVIVFLPSPPPPPLFHCVLGWLSTGYCPLQCGYAPDHLITPTIFFRAGLPLPHLSILMVTLKRPVRPLTSPRPLWRHSPQPPLALPESLWFQARWKKKKKEEREEEECGRKRIRDD